MEQEQMTTDKLYDIVGEWLAGSAKEQGCGYGEVNGPDVQLERANGEIVSLGLRPVVKLLADTMRENERLWSVLQYVANGEDSTVEKLIEDFESYQKQPPSDCEHVYKAEMGLIGHIVFCGKCGAHYLGDLYKPKTSDN